MNRATSLIALVVGLVVAMCGGSLATAGELAVGDAAPDFTLEGTDGVAYRLRDFVGKQAIVVAWFPKAFTPG